MSGVEYNAGALTLLIGVLAIFLVFRFAGQGMANGHGPLTFAALGLLAAGLVGITILRIHQSQPFSISWGVYVSGASAVWLVFEGLMAFGVMEDAPPPLD